MISSCFRGTFCAVAVALAACGGGASGAGKGSDVPGGGDVLSRIDLAAIQDRLAGDAARADDDADGLAGDPGGPADDADALAEDPGGTDDDPGETIDCSQPGGLKGKACAPNATTSVAFASVSVVVTGPCAPGGSQTFTDAADATGAWEIDNLPPGTASITVSKGSYRSTSQATVSAGNVTNLSGGIGAVGQHCFSAAAASIAVIQGSADRIEDLLTDLGLNHTDFADGTTKTVLTSAAHGLLTDPVALAKFDILFIDCSTTVEPMLEPSGSSSIPANSAIGDNLKAFVEGGGSVYASDWAWAYIQAAWPGQIAFSGDPNSFQEGTKSGHGPRQGPGPASGAKAYTTQGDVVDQNLEQALGKSSTTIYFNQAIWVVIDGPGSGSTEVQADITGLGTKPLIVSFQPAGTTGHVFYTSFHNIAQSDAGGNVDDIKAILSYVVFSL
jgi:hypothetical protein